MKPSPLILTVVLLAAPFAPAAPSPVPQLLEGYRAQGAGPFSAAGGERLWNSETDGRRCSGCHTPDPRRPGRHQKTHKPIEPMAPSVNPQRLSDAAKIEKWFTRNCKWTLGRACTPQEKGDFLTWLNPQ